MLKRKDVEFMGILGSSPLIVTSSFEESSMEHGALFCNGRASLTRQCVDNL